MHIACNITVNHLFLQVFGAYCSASWHTRHEKNKPHTSFFGTGETFVFTFQPCPIKFPWTGTLGDNAPAHPVDHFMAGDDTMLVVGSGQVVSLLLSAAQLFPLYCLQVGCFPSYCLAAKHHAREFWVLSYLYLLQTLHRKLVQIFLKLLIICSTDFDH